VPVPELTESLSIKDLAVLLLVQLFQRYTAYEIALNLLSQLLTTSSVLRRVLVARMQFIQLVILLFVLFLAAVHLLFTINICAVDLSKTIGKVIHFELLHKLMLYPVISIVHEYVLLLHACLYLYSNDSHRLRSLSARCRPHREDPVWQASQARSIGGLYQTPC